MLLLPYICLRAMRFLLLFSPPLLTSKRCGMLYISSSQMQYSRRLPTCKRLAKASVCVQVLLLHYPSASSLVPCRRRCFLTGSAEQFAVKQKPSWTGFCLSTEVRCSERPLKVPWRTQEALPDLRQQSDRRTQLLVSELTCRRCGHSYKTAYLHGC